MNNRFNVSIAEYVKEIQKSIDICAEKEDYTLMSRRVHFKELPDGYKIMPQHALWNAIIESYVPQDFDMKGYGLYYAGDFSGSSVNDFSDRMHKALKEYALSVEGRWHPAEYFRQVDTFNKLNKVIFQSDHLVYYSWEKKWDALELAHGMNRKLNFTEIHGIIMQNIQFAFTLYSYVFDGKLMSFMKGLDTYEAICRVDERAAKIIRNGIFDNTDSIFETLEKRSEAGAYVMNIIKSHHIEPLSSMIHAGAAKEEQLIDLLIGIGVKPFISDASESKIHPKPGVLGRKYGAYVYPKTIHASYLRGLESKEDHFLSISSAMTSLLITKTQIAPVADMNKRLTLSSKRMSAHPDRDHKCGTQYFRNYTIRKESDLKRIEGMYEQVGVKTVKIDITNFEKYKNKTVRLRTPLTCNTSMEGGVCRYCLGDKLYDLNRSWKFRDGTSNVATTWINIEGPKVQQSVLSAKHNNAPNPLKPTYYYIKPDGTHDYNWGEGDIEMHYAYEDRVFFKYKGELVIPDSIQLLKPEHVNVPWTNKTPAKFSTRIQVRFDDDIFVIESDTDFFIYDHESHKETLALRHLYKNIGVTHRYQMMKVAEKSFGKNDNPNRFSIDAYADVLDNIDSKNHIAFYHLIFADNVRLKNNISKIPDFSIPDQEFVIIKAIDAIKNGFSLAATFAAGYFIYNMVNPMNFSPENKLYTDIDHVV